MSALMPKAELGMSVGQQDSLLVHDTALLLLVFYIFVHKNLETHSP